MKKMIIALLATGLLSGQALAGDKEWYYVWDSCSNCDSDGSRGQEANLRFFISNPVFAGEHDYDCKEGSFYNKSNLNGHTSNGYSSESKANRSIDEDIHMRKRDGWLIHRVGLERYPEDC